MTSASFASIPPPFAELPNVELFVTSVLTSVRTPLSLYLIAPPAKSDLPLVSTKPLNVNTSTPSEAVSRIRCDPVPLMVSRSVNAEASTITLSLAFSVAN